MNRAVPETADDALVPEENSGSWLAPCALAIFLMSGTLKGQIWLAWLPIDLTVASAGLVALLVAVRFLRDLFAIPLPAVPWFALFIVIIPSFLWTEWTDYARVKVLHFFTLTLLSIVASHFLLKSERDLANFLDSLAMICGLITVDTLLAVFTGHERVFEGRAGLSAQRDEVYSNVIALGRATSFACLYVFSKWVTGNWFTPKAVILFSLAVIACVSSGSRAPLLSVAVAILVLLLLVHSQRLILYIPYAGISVAIIVSVLLVGSFLPETAVNRIAEAAKMKRDNSIDERLWMWRLTTWKSLTTPQGLGLGGFAEWISRYRSAEDNRRFAGSDPHNSGIGRDYPHNFILESFLEGGWLFGGLFCALCGRSWLRSLWLARERQDDPMGSLALMACTAGLLWMFFSGDLNDNRLVFGLLSAISLAPDLVRAEILGFQAIPAQGRLSHGTKIGSRAT